MIFSPPSAVFFFVGWCLSIWIQSLKDEEKRLIRCWRRRITNGRCLLTKQMAPLFMVTKEGHHPDTFQRGSINTPKCPVLSMFMISRRLISHVVDESSSNPAARTFIYRRLIDSLSLAWPTFEFQDEMCSTIVQFVAQFGLKSSIKSRF